MLHRTSVRIGGLASSCCSPADGRLGALLVATDRSYEVPEQDFLPVSRSVGAQSCHSRAAESADLLEQVWAGIEQSSGDSADRSGLLLARVGPRAQVDRRALPHHTRRAGSPVSPDGLGLPDDLRKSAESCGLQALAEFPKTGGTLIGVQVLGGGLNQVFGFL